MTPLLLINFVQYFLQILSNHSDDWPFIRLFLQQRNQKLFNWSTKRLVPDFIWGFYDFLKYLLIVISDVKRISMQNFIKNNPQRPNINSVRVVVKSGLFRSNIFLGSCYCLHDDFLCAQSKISNFDGGKWFSRNILGFEKNVLRFEVSVGDSMIMQFLDAFADLEYALQSVLLGHFVVFGSIEGIPKWSSFAELGDIPDRSCCFNDIENLEDILILYFFEFFVNDSLFFDILGFALISIDPPDGEGIIDFGIKDAVDLDKGYDTWAKLPSPTSYPLERSNSLLKYLEVTFIKYYTNLIWKWPFFLLYSVGSPLKSLWQLY